LAGTDKGDSKRLQLHSTVPSAAERHTLTRSWIICPQRGKLHRMRDRNGGKKFRRSAQSIAFPCRAQISSPTHRPRHLWWGVPLPHAHHSHSEVPHTQPARHMGIPHKSHLWAPYDRSVEDAWEGRGWNWRNSAAINWENIGGRLIAPIILINFILWTCPTGWRRNNSPKSKGEPLAAQHNQPHRRDVFLSKSHWTQLPCAQTTF